MCPACVRVSGYRGLFLFVSTRVLNNPPSFFQKTNTGSVRVANLICSSGFFARANRLFHRFRTVFCARNGIVVTLYESRVRSIPPSDLYGAYALVRSESARVVIGVYYYIFRHGSVIIRQVSFQIQIWNPYGLF